MFHTPYNIGTPTLWNGGNGDRFVPKVDISEDENNMYVHLELAGMEKDDVKITVSDDRVLTIKGEKKKKEEKKEGKNYILIETSYGSFMRSFVLPNNIKEDEISGEFDKGFLNLTLPKKEENKSTEKEISLN